MKKNYFMLTFGLLFTVFGLRAQVVNGNFEIVKPNLLPSNWGMNFTQNVVIGPSGQSVSDNIQYTTAIPSMVYSTEDAHTGLHAMEISNAFNQTQNTVIQGSATIFADASQDSPGWNPGIPVNPGADIERLGFYYKFLPAGNEVAQAKMKLFNAAGEQIGYTSVDIPATPNNQYHYIYSYIYYNYSQTPAFMQVTFNMAKSGHTPTFGSRLLIDNVITNHQALAIIENQGSAFAVYPTLADNTINIVSAESIRGNINYRIINAQGSVIKENNETASTDYIYSMDISGLSSGVYFLQIASNSERTTKKFIKR